jgi:hypothetical protein
MISAQEIKQKLALVAANRLSLNAFEDWFVSNSWNVHKESSLEAVELVASIHLLLSERDDRVLNESSLRNGLVSLLSSAKSFVYHVSHVEDVAINPILVACRPLTSLVSARAKL